MSLKLLLRTAGALLLVGAVVLINLGIMYSSIPHYQQMGWAEFCSINAIWVAVLGLASFIIAESHEVAMRQLDLNERKKDKV